MPNIGDSERKTQNRVIEFFQTKLHYRYIGNLKDQANRNIDEEKLTRWLTDHGYSSAVATRAVEELVKVIYRQPCRISAFEIRCKNQRKR